MHLFNRTKYLPRIYTGGVSEYKTEFRGNHSVTISWKIPEVAHVPLETALDRGEAKEKKTAGSQQSEQQIKLNTHLLFQNYLQISFHRPSRRIANLLG